MNRNRAVSILGATGSIGRSALDIIERHPDRYRAVALASRGDFRGIVDLARRHRPRLVALLEPSSAAEAREALKGLGIPVREGVEGILEAATLPEADVVVSAIVGAAGIRPTYAAVESGKVVALANKEALVAAGRVITGEAERRGARLVPVDSEHSAVYQVLLGQDRRALRRLVLTASGGPFFGKGGEDLDRVTPAMALAHPRWRMGRKVTIDSATLMNKGLEVIEAHWLFGLGPDDISVLVHPQSIIHGMAEFADGTTLAQMGPADMRIPIAFALGCPERIELPLPPMDLARAGRLEFFQPDLGSFPCLDLAYRALRAGEGAPAVLSAANEIAVEAFLAGKLAFTAIPKVVEAVVDEGLVIDDTTLDGVLEGDRKARAAARDAIARISAKP